MNLKSFIAPVVTLVYGVICGFLVCYGKATNDWGSALTAIAGFTSAFGAFVSGVAVLYVFLQWRDQKGSEVVAKEAKDAMYLIDEISGFYLKINTNSSKMENEILLSNLKSTTVKLQDKLKFFIFDELDEKNTIANYLVLTTTILSLKQDKEDFVDVVNSTIVDFIAGKYKALDILKNYAMYRKKIRYAKKSLDSLSHLPE